MLQQPGAGEMRLSSADECSSTTVMAERMRGSLPSDRWHRRRGGAQMPGTMGVVAPKRHGGRARDAGLAGAGGRELLGCRVGGNSLRICISTMWQQARPGEGKLGK